ncbi:MAG: succinate dehydrogenase assembly factor 2 [Gammaproteobacteria bacterium]
MDVARLKRLRWRCRRGMRELDLLLEPWLARHGETMDTAALAEFERFLDCPDMDLHDWLTGRSEPGDPHFAELIAHIRAPAPPF